MKGVYYQFKVGNATWNKVPQGSSLVTFLMPFTIPWHSANLNPCLVNLNGTKVRMQPENLHLLLIGRVREKRVNITTDSFAQPHKTLSGQPIIDRNRFYRFQA